MQRIFLRVPRTFSRRTLAIPSRTYASSFKSGPSPPRLPKEEQELFERLQRDSTGAFSTPASQRDSPPTVNQSSDSSSSTAAQDLRARINQSPDSDTEIRIEGRLDAEGEGEELHPNMRRGAPPEFEGEVNPKTGEVGGPKNEPLRWGHGGDWSYNGRVTDF